MALIGERSFGTDYAAAEKFADGWAGDTQEHAAVVEDFNLGPENDPEAGAFLVMDYSAAVRYVESHDAEIQYDADHTQAADICPHDGAPLSEHIGGKPCIVSPPSTAKTIFDLPIAAWAWKEDGRDLRA